MWFLGDKALLTERTENASHSRCPASLPQKDRLPGLLDGPGGRTICAGPSGLVVKRKSTRPLQAEKGAHRASSGSALDALRSKSITTRVMMDSVVRFDCCQIISSSTISNFYCSTSRRQFSHLDVWWVFACSPRMARIAAAAIGTPPPRPCRY